MWIWFLVIVIIFEVLADVFAKEWSLQDKSIFWVGTIIAYVIATIFWLNALKGGSGLARGTVIFSVGSAILALIIGVVVYKESVGVLEIIGMILGLIAIALIFWNEA